MLKSAERRRVVQRVAEAFTDPAKQTEVLHAMAANDPGALGAAIGVRGGALRVAADAPTAAPSWAGGAALAALGGAGLVGGGALLHAARKKSLAATRRRRTLAGFAGAGGLAAALASRRNK